MGVGVNLSDEDSIKSMISCHVYLIFSDLVFIQYISKN